MIRKYFYYITYSIFFLNILAVDQNAYSWPGIPYPLHGTSGETILWLGRLGDMTPTPDGNYFLLFGRNVIKGRGMIQIYVLDPGTGVLRSTDLFEKYIHITFSPDGEKMALIINDSSDDDFGYSLASSGRQKLKIYHYRDGDFQLLYRYENVQVSMNPFSPDSRQILFNQNTPFLLNLDTGEETAFPESMSLGQFFLPDGKHIVSVEKIVTDPVEDYYGYSKPYVTNIWDIDSQTRINSYSLEDIFLSHYYRDKNISLTYLGLNADRSALIAVEGIAYAWAYSGLDIHCLNMNTGGKIWFYHPSNIATNTFAINYIFSPNMQWIALIGNVDYNCLVDLTQDLSDDQILQTEDFLRGPGEGWETGGFDIESKKFYFSKQKIEWQGKYALGLLDLESNTITERVIDRRTNPTVAALASKTPTVVVDSDIDTKAVQRWDYNSISYLGNIELNEIPETGTFTVRYEREEKRLAVGKGNAAIIVDASSWSTLASVSSADHDARTMVSFSNDSGKFLTASGSHIGSGTDNLIRIWNTDTWDMVREIHGHTDSVWYAAFSLDDQRIVSASLDGTTKVWNVESGSLVSEFVGHATGVVYAEFLPDGQRVLSAGNDSRAFIWNTETAAVEQTIENIHLPAQLSPDGKYLFAGSEVWELASGQVIKTLDGIAQDYTCLTLSPDGTLLLTCESNGLTKVWNVQEHILGGSGIRGFQTY